MSVFWGINWKYGFVFIFPLIHWFCFSEQKSFENIRFMKLIYVFHNFTYNFTRFSTLWIKWIRKHEIKNYNIQNIWTSSYSQYILIIINNYWILEKCNPPPPPPTPPLGRHANYIHVFSTIIQLDYCFYLFIFSENL